jgi:hypothetical protein
MIAFHRAFEMGDEGRAFDLEVVVIVHGFIPLVGLILSMFDLSPPRKRRSRLSLAAPGEAEASKGDEPGGISAVHPSRLAARPPQDDGARAAAHIQIFSTLP